MASAMYKTRMMAKALKVFFMTSLSDVYKRQELGHCVLKDDAAAIAAKMHDADVLVFATPVYYYCVSGQLKTCLLYTSSVPHVSETLRGQGVERQTLPLLGLGWGCSRKTQRAFGTAMRLCASLSRRRRGPAGLRDLFYFCRNCGLYALRSGPFRVCEARGGITTFSALYVLLKRRTAACQNGSFAVF